MAIWYEDRNRYRSFNPIVWPTYDGVTGAWLSGQIRLAPPGRYQTNFFWDVVPEWVPMPSAHDVRRELADYPRAVDAIPSWMREQLG